MNKNKRALRRHHRNRMLCKARRIMRLWRIPESFQEQNIVRLADNLAFCSCWMCQNERKIFKQVTLKEKSFYCEPID